MGTFFQEVIEAVSDFKFYKRVKDFPVSKGIKYIFLLIFLITLIFTIQSTYVFGKWVAKNLPPIEIQNGVAYVDAKQPYETSFVGTIFIIDTTGEITSLDKYEKGLLLTKDKFIIKSDRATTQTFELVHIIKGPQKLTIDGKRVWNLFPLFLILHYIRLCMSKFFHILFFSLVSLAISSISGIKLNYRQLFNIGIYAITLSVLLETLLIIVGRQLPFFSIIYFGVYIIYLIMAVTSCKEEQATVEHQF
jgi:hypothetical protein